MTEPALDQNSLPDDKFEVRLLPGMSVPDAVRQIIEHQSTTFETMLPVALVGDDIEGVHKVRVSLRRMRTCLKLTRPYFQENLLAATRVDLKFIRQVFGRVRDMDVFRMGYSSFFEKFYSGKDFDTLIWQPAFGFTYQDYTNQIHARVTLEIISQLRQTLDEFHTSDTMLKSSRKLSTLPADLGSFLPVILNSQLEAILTFVINEEGDRNFPNHHQLRLFIKAHRYTYEFFQSILDPWASRAVIDHLIQLQDYLGELNDSVQAIRFLRTHQSPNLSKSVSDTIKAYIDDQLEKQNNLVNNFPNIWEEFLAINLRPLLEEAISPL